MTPIHPEATQTDAAEPSHPDARTELRDALVAIAITVAGVASAVAMVVIPQRLPSPEQAPIVCKSSAGESQAGSSRFR